MILIVDDNPDNLFALKKLLELNHFVVETANSGEQALKLILKKDFVLIILDVQMPGTMDGLKLSHYIRDRWPPVKLLVASGMTILEESSLPMGSMFSPKPYNDDEIIDKMAQLLLSDGKSFAEVHG